jgi:hypothetical protein
MDVSLTAYAILSDYIVDIGVGDGSGNIFVVAENLRIGGRNLAVRTYRYTIPVRVRRGAPIYLRGSSAAADSTFGAVIRGMSVNVWGVPGSSRLVALYTSNSSRGQTVNPGTTSNTKPAYTQMHAGYAARITGLIAAVGQNADIARTTGSWLMDISSGAAGQERVIIPNVLFAAEANHDAPLPTVFGPWPCDVGPSRRWAARAQCSITTAGDRTFDLALYGLIA